MTLIDRLSKLEGPDREQREKLNDVLQRNIEAGHKAIRVFWDTYEDHQRCILRAKEASNAE